MSAYRNARALMAQLDEPDTDWDPQEIGETLRDLLNDLEAMSDAIVPALQNAVVSAAEVARIYGDGYPIMAATSTAQAERLREIVRWFA